MKELLFKNWKTTLFGLISVVLFSLVSFGILTPEQSDAINEGVNAVSQNLNNGFSVQTLSEIVLVVGNILLLFAKDPNKNK